MQKEKGLFSLLGGIYNRVYTPVLFILVMSLCLSVKSWAAFDTVVLETISNYSTQCTGYNNGLQNWEQVNDYPVVVSPATYVGVANGATGVDTYNMSTPSVSEGVIQSVEIIGYFYSNVVGSQWRLGCVDGDGHVFSPNTYYDVTTQGNYGNRIYNTNPNTGAAWTWDEVSGMCAIVDIKAASGSTAICWCLSAAVKVTYEVETTGSLPGSNVVYQVPGFVSDWTGEYTTDFETYKSQSLIYPWGSSGPAVFISKRDFITMAGFFGAILAGIITWVLFRAIV